MVSRSPRCGVFRLGGQSKPSALPMGNIPGGENYRIHGTTGNREKALVGNRDNARYYIFARRFDRQGARRLGCIRELLRGRRVVMGKARGFWSPPIRIRL